MGKIDLPAPPENNVSIKEDKGPVSENFAIDDIMKGKIKANLGINNEEENENDKDQLMNKALKLLNYRRFLDIKMENLDEVHNLKKIDKLLEENGFLRQSDKIEKIKEIQYKIGGRPDMGKVYNYLFIELQIKELVNKLRKI